MRTYVYIDGFNLYYGALKGTPYKWLDVKALFKAILRPENELLKIKYYTARVSARPDNPDAPTRQDFYLQALEAHIPELEITHGHFIQKPVKMRLVEKMRFRHSMYVRVLKSEEKGSDVNLSVHLVNDAWNNCYDCAIVCSNDGDMAEAMRIVRRERHKSVVLVVPGDPVTRPASSQLRRWASKTMHIPQGVLAACQLPNPIPGTSIHKPKDWA
ncbi:MAG TPA: NYN domain-containing protein [Burkholderiales bacterium]|nr:NYN domain-containing protein [Burkholderiales bacterium]